MEWPSADRLIEHLDASARETLLSVLELPDDLRAEFIGKAFREDSPFADLLIELEIQTHARRSFLELLNRSLRIHTET